MQMWFVYSVVALVLWGCWGFFNKVATLYMPSQSVAVFSGPVSLVISLGILAFMGFAPELHPKGVLFAILGAAAGGLGGIAFVYAAGSGNISLVVALTSLYPPVTLALSALILREPITVQKVIGVGLAVVAILVLTVEPAGDAASLTSGTGGVETS